MTDKDAKYIKKFYCKECREKNKHLSVVYKSKYADKVKDINDKEKDGDKREKKHKEKDREKKKKKDKDRDRDKDREKHRENIEITQL